MIDILGIQRILMLAVLVAVNAVLAAGVYMYLIPENVAKQREKNSIQGQVSTVRADIDRMQVEFEQLEEQRAEFEALDADSFFKNQSRREAELVFNSAQKRSGVSKAVAKIEAGKIEDNEEAQKAEHKVLRSPMSVELQAMDDISVLHYIHLIEQEFPGHVSVENIEIKRQGDVNKTILNAIGSGKNPPLVSANVDMVWRTMIPEASIIEEEGDQ